MAAGAVTLIGTNISAHKWCLNSMHAGHRSPLWMHQLHTQHPNGTVIGVVTDTPMHAHARPQGRVLRGDRIDHDHHWAGEPHPLVGK